MNIRPFEKADTDAIIELFAQSVHYLTVGDYDASQREAWAPRSANRREWIERIGRLTILVADHHGSIAGFIGFDPCGYIDLLFVSPDHARQGIASALYRETEAMLIDAGITELRTDSSVTARPFFERQGFRVDHEQEVSRGRARLRRFAMRKTIPPTGA